MTIRDKRILLTSCTAGLIREAERLGYYPALDQVKRTVAEAEANARAGTGIRNSLHILGLAVDLLLYNQEGLWLTSEEHYRPLGEWWERQHALAYWGGHFRDPGHFSIEHEGVR